VSVVGNLPYYITSDILLHLFSFANRSTLSSSWCRRKLPTIVPLPQAARLRAALCYCQPLRKVEKLFTLPPARFRLRPRCISSVVRLVMSPKLDSLGVPEEEFVQFLKLSFGQKAQRCGTI